MTAKQKLAGKALVGKLSGLALEMVSLAEKKKRSKKTIGNMLKALELFKARRLATVSSMPLAGENSQSGEAMLKPQVSERAMKRRRNKLIRQIKDIGPYEMCASISKELFRDTRTRRVICDACLVDRRQDKDSYLFPESMIHLLKQTEKDLDRYRGIGRIGITRIETTLNGYGLRLGMTDEEISQVFPESAR